MAEKQNNRQKSNSAKTSAQSEENTGKYYRIEVRPKTEFIKFRYHDVGKPGGIQRLAGQRVNKTWDTHAWLIEKGMAHIEKGKLVADTVAAKEVLDQIGDISHLKEDIFKGPAVKKPRGEKMKRNM